MTQVLVDNRRNAWNKGGTSVDATSAIDVAKQAGLDWTVSLTDLYAEKTIDVSALFLASKQLLSMDMMVTQPLV